MLDESSAEIQETGAVIVTGASSGIGAALSRQLAQGGTRVIAIGRDPDRLTALAAESPLIGPVTFDLSDIARIDILIGRVIGAHGSIRGLINNAAVQEDVRIDDENYDHLRIAREIAVNLTAPIALCRALLPHLLAQPSSVIVNVTSGLAFVPKRTSAVYSATKAGLHLFSEGLRVQARGSGLLVTEAVMPMVDTPMTAGRGCGKISAEAAASAILSGVEAGQTRIWVGKARLLPPLLRFAPFVARGILQRA